MAFNIDLVFVDDFTSRQIEIVKRAARRWEEIVVGDLPDVDLKSNPLTFWHVGLIDVYIDDIRIFVFKADLEEHIAGSGGPTGPSERYSPNNYARPFRESLPCAGRIILNRSFFDSDYAIKKELYNIVLHKIGHVLGIGTLTRRITVFTEKEAYFPGTEAVQAFDDVGGKKFTQAERYQWHLAL